MNRHSLLRLLCGTALALSVTAAPAAAETESGFAHPTASATDAEWQAWAQALAAEVSSTDWAADSAARGCDMLSVDIQYATLPESTGAPAGLQVPVVNRAEDCSAAAHLSTTAALDEQGEAAGACATTSGPGTICLSRSGSFVTASFTYRGSSSPQGFIRIYDRSGSGCGTGTTRATGSTHTYSNGDTHSVSYSGGYDSYSASFWRKAIVGHTNWGTVCDSL